MSWKVLSLVFVVLLPGVAVAQGCHGDKTTATMSCAADKIYDEALKACVPVSG